MSRRRAGPAPSTDPVDELEPDVEHLEVLEDVRSIPLKVRRSLREVLGDEGEQVEQVWLDALASDSERTRVEAAKVLTQAAVALAKGWRREQRRAADPETSRGRGAALLA
jgi:hypothetical protein